MNPLPTNIVEAEAELRKIADEWRRVKFAYASKDSRWDKCEEMALRTEALATLVSSALKGEPDGVEEAIADIGESVEEHLNPSATVTFGIITTALRSSQLRLELLKRERDGLRKTIENMAPQKRSET